MSIMGAYPPDPHAIWLKSMPRKPDWRGVSPHNLRHTSSKMLIDQGIGLERLAHLAGNSSLNTTKVYVLPSEQDQGMRLRLSVKKGRRGSVVTASKTSAPDESKVSSRGRY